jgi:iron complex transport system permease protein
MLVYLLASRSAHDQTLYVILSGLALTSLIGGATMGVLLFAKQYQVSQFVFWTMGGLEGRMWQHIIWPLPAILIVGFLALKHWRWLDILALGEQSAHGVGLNVKRSQILLLIAATILTAMAIAIAGPIGFIGLMVPHLVRMLVGPTHRILLPYSMLFGALFLLLCDLFGRWAISPFEIKAGVITSVVGGLYFVFLIINIQRKGRIL